MLLRNRIKYSEILEKIIKFLSDIILNTWRILLALAALRILEII